MPARRMTCHCYADEPKRCRCATNPAILSRLGTPESAFAASRPGGCFADHRRDRDPCAGHGTAGGRRRHRPRRTRVRAWRTVPAPRRGELVRLLGEELRAAKADLGRLVTLEAGKILSEGLGEVQEMIDICDFAVGLSRQLYGRTIATERADHRMMEMLASARRRAASFPRSTSRSRCGRGTPRWRWSAAIRWSGSRRKRRRSPRWRCRRCSSARQRRFGDAPAGLCEVLIGGRDTGEALVDDPRIAVVSATGSTAMGRAVGPRLAARFARAILELGGNNAAIVAPSADLDLAVRAVAFAAMGTAGQRCTTLRRLFVHADIYDRVLARLSRVYASVKVGDPREARHAGRPADRPRRLRRPWNGRWTRRAPPAAPCTAASASPGSAGRRPITCARRCAKCRRRPVRCCARPSRRSST